MSRYRKVDPRIWNDAKFVALSDQGKLVFFMLLTHPNMTALGAMRATVPGLAEELGWPLEAFREAFREATAKGMAEHDEKGRMIALPKFLRYNPPESPNVVKAWAAAVDLLPECRLKAVVIQRARAFAEGMSKAFHEALPEALAKGMPYQEQEQEQEQEKDQERGAATATPPPQGQLLHVEPEPEPTASKRGTRLPVGWEPSRAAVAWALAEGVTDAVMARELPKFRDYWAAAAGKDGVKLDWDATWRNWIRRAVTGFGAGSSGGKPAFGAKVERSTDWRAGTVANADGSVAI